MTTTEDASVTECVIEAEGWSAIADLEALAERAARAALAEAGVSAEGREIAILFADDDALAALNAQFRGKPAPTNVLSWPAHSLRPPAPGRAPPPPPAAAPFGGALGDVALGFGTVAKEAQLRDLALGAHVAHLIAHGVLHLLGYDHVDNADAALMEAAERRALARIGVRDPYE
ncbi:MAG: rRNA maturation RNase YbeY [Rubrimonas sp.]